MDNSYSRHNQQHCIHYLTNTISMRTHTRKNIDNMKRVLLHHQQSVGVAGNVEEDIVGLYNKTSKEYDEGLMSVRDILKNYELNDNNQVVYKSNRLRPVAYEDIPVMVGFARQDSAKEKCNDPTYAKMVDETLKQMGLYVPLPLLKKALFPDNKKVASRPSNDKRDFDVTDCTTVAVAGDDAQSKNRILAKKAEAKPLFPTGLHMGNPSQLGLTSHHVNPSTPMDYAMMGVQYGRMQGLFLGEQSYRSEQMEHFEARRKDDQEREDKRRKDDQEREDKRRKEDQERDEQRRKEELQRVEGWRKEQKADMEKQIDHERVNHEKHRQEIRDDTRFIVTRSEKKIIKSCATPGKKISSSALASPASTSSSTSPASTSSPDSTATTATTSSQESSIAGKLRRLYVDASLQLPASIQIPDVNQVQNSDDILALLTSIATNKCLVFSGDSATKSFVFISENDKDEDFDVDDAMERCNVIETDLGLKYKVMILVSFGEDCVVELTVVAPEKQDAFDLCSSVIIAIGRLDDVTAIELNGPSREFASDFPAKIDAFKSFMESVPSKVCFKNLRFEGSTSTLKGPEDVLILSEHPLEFDKCDFPCHGNSFAQAHLFHDRSNLRLTFIGTKLGCDLGNLCMALMKGSLQFLKIKDASLSIAEFETLQSLCRQAILRDWSLSFESDADISDKTLIIVNVKYGSKHIKEAVESSPMLGGSPGNGNLKRLADLDLAKAKEETTLDIRGRDFQQGGSNEGRDTSAGKTSNTSTRDTSNTSTLHIGDRVQVSSGKYKDCLGSVCQIKNFIQVQIDGCGVFTWLNPKSLQKIGG